MQIASTNRKAYHDYHIEDTLEAGLVLTGTEIKSIREGRVSLRDSYARPEDGELWLLNCHIAQYQGGNRYNHEPTRPRKLLVHRGQLASISREVVKNGYTIVPLKLYFKGRLAKVELGLVKGKKVYDKRQSIIQREAKREMEHSIKLQN